MNEKERATAKRNYHNAEGEMWRIEDLPQQPGQVVIWNNGVVWIRAGDDDWVAEHEPDRHYPSVHVAMKGMRAK